MKKISTEDIATKPLYRKKFDPNLAAKAAKMVAPPHLDHTYDQSGSRTFENNAYAFKPALDKRAQRNISNMQVMEILPDQRLMIQVLVASIQAPKDLTSLELIYKAPKNIFQATLGSRLTSTLKDYIEEVYRFKQRIPGILTKSLGTHGSVPLLVLPENAIDDFINGERQLSTESLTALDREIKSHKGILGNPTTTQSKLFSFSSEARREYSKQYDPRMTLVYGQDKDNYPDEEHRVEHLEYIQVTDNVNILKIPSVKAKLAQQRLADISNKSSRIVKQGRQIRVESFRVTDFSQAGETKQQVVNQAAMDRLLQQRRSPKMENIARIKRQNELHRKSVGDGIVIELPSECFVPVFIQGDMKNPIGGFIAVDDNGAPLHFPPENSLNGNVGKTATNNVSNSLVQRISTNLHGTIDQIDPSNKAHMDMIYRIGADMMEQDLVSRLSNGALASDVTIAKNDLFYMVMLQRQLAKKYTQLLFVPSEYVTYFAFDYTPDGLGKSVLDNNATLNIFRSVLLYADVIGSIKNSIGRSKLNIKYDETDPDPARTAERAVHEYIMSRQLRLPNTMSSPADNIEFVQRAGVEVEMTGHPGLPDTQITVENRNSGYQKPDVDIQDQLKRQTIMSAGMPPELIDNVNQAEFATTVVSQNIIYSKNVLTYQQIFNPLMTRHLRCYVNNSENLRAQLLQDIRESIDMVKLDKQDIEELYGIEVDDSAVESLKATVALQLFINGVDVELPAPVSVNLEQQMKEFDTFTEAATKAIDSNMNSSFFNDKTAGDVTGDVETYRAMILSHLQREWMAQKGFMPELSALMADAADGEEQFNLMQATLNHIKQLTRNTTAIVVKLQPMIAAANKDLQNSQVDAQGASGSESSSSDSSSSDDSQSGGTDDGLGSDDGLGADDGLGDGGDAGADDAKKDDGFDDEFSLS